MIEVKGLTQSFGKKLVLDHVDLTIEKNEICALVGRNGAGKSTFINSLLGLLPTSEGTIRINGTEREKKRKTRKNEIAYLPEKFMLYPSLTGLENMIFFAETGEGKTDSRRMEEILRAVRLWGDRNITIKNYSKGMLQRLGLAVTLYQNSDILVLDEPTSGLDPIGRKEILEVLKALSGKTILLSSHHLDEISKVCSHVAFIEDGKIDKFSIGDFLMNEKLGVRI